ncbi:MAG: hypothetical protein R2911_40865 [Caldilineaceae bacterium]
MLHILVSIVVPRSLQSSVDMYSNRASQLCDVVCGMLYAFRSIRRFIVSTKSLLATDGQRSGVWGRLYEFGVQFVEEGVEAWQLPAGAVLAIIIVPLLVAASGVGFALFGKGAYKWYIQEDGFAENVQVLLLACTLLMAMAVTYREWFRGTRWVALMYAVLCCGFVFLIGEELTWGQRIFQWTTTATFAAINKQNETNLHNIESVEQVFKWVQLLVGAYGFLLPLVIFNWKWPEWLKKELPAFIPPPTLMPAFAALFVWRLYRNLLPAPKQFYFFVSEYNEVLELTLALGLFLFMVFQLRRKRE